MVDIQEKLFHYRAEINRLDATMQEALQQRFSMVKEIAALKPASELPLRLVREAQIMEARLDAHEPPLPLSTLWAIWREIIGASSLQQRPFTVATLKAEPLASLMARDMFGVEASLLQVSTSLQLAEILLKGKMVAMVSPAIAMRLALQYQGKLWVGGSFTGWRKGLQEECWLLSSLAPEMAEKSLVLSAMPYEADNAENVLLPEEWLVTINHIPYLVKLSDQSHGVLLGRWLPVFFE
ncbi:MAG: chorismate mutase [Alphaproteobacteria bacterium]